jgi:hypothetical protein
MWKICAAIRYSKLVLSYSRARIFLSRAQMISMEIAHLWLNLGTTMVALVDLLDASVGALPLRMQSALVGSSGGRRALVVYGYLGGSTHTLFGWFDRSRSDATMVDMRASLRLDSAVSTGASTTAVTTLAAAIFVSMLEKIGSKLLVYRGSFNEEVLSV